MNIDNKQVCSGNVAFYTTKILVDLSGMVIACPVTFVLAENKDKFGFMFPYKSSYINVFNY